MKRSVLLVSSMLMVFVMLTISQTKLVSRQAQPPAGYANDPDNSGVATCTSCHNGTASVDSTKFILKMATTQAGLANVVSGSTTYQADSTYWMSITATAPTTDCGFEITAVKADNNMAGSFTLTSTSTTTLGTYTPSGYTVRQYVGHKNAYSSPQTTWQFKWTAPHTALGPVTFYYVGMNANGQDNEGGDVVYRVTKTIREATATPPPTVSIAQTGGTNPTCAGSSVTFTATPTNGGTNPTYQWKVNGTNTATGVTFTTSSLTNGQTVTCVITTSGNLTATSNSIVMTINPVVTPAVSISATSATTLCAGQAFSFSATPTNGGSTPSYQWKVNGTNAGTGASYSSALNNSDAVTCVMTSNATCASPTTATSNSVSVTVNPSVTPTISINTSTPSVCAGQSVSFTSSITNGGSAPSYQWKVNGTNSGTGSTFSST